MSCYQFKSFLYLHIEDMVQSVNFAKSKVSQTPDCGNNTMPAVTQSLQRCVPVSFSISLLKPGLVFLSSPVAGAYLSLLPGQALREVLENYTTDFPNMSDLHVSSLNHPSCGNKIS